MEGKQKQINRIRILIAEAKAEQLLDKSNVYQKWIEKQYAEIENIKNDRQKSTGKENSH